MRAHIASPGLLLGFGLALALAPRAAHGDPANIVIESHVGERPKDAARILAPITEELAKFGYQASVQDVGELYEQAISRPGLATWRSASDITAKAEQGYEAYISGRFSEASATLVPLLSDVRTSPAMIASQQAVRNAVFKASVATAISQARLHRDDEAAAEMAELIRSFPDQAVTRSAHGPEAEKLYVKTKRQIERDGRGVLRVVAADKDTSIYVNELFVNNGTATRPDLVPGVYRVYAQRGTLAGRVYFVEVKANAEASLAFDWAYDQALHTSPYWTGFSFSTEAVRQRAEAPAAARLGRELEASQIVVLAITARKGRAVLIGSVIDVGAKAVQRTATMALEPDPSVTKLVAMAQFLAGKEDVPGFASAAPSGIPIAEGPLPVASLPDVTSATGKPSLGATDRPQPRHNRQWIPYTALATGALAAGASAYLFAKDGDGTCAEATCVYQYETTAPAIATAAVGVALVTVAIVGFANGWHHAPPQTSITASYGRQTLSIGLAGRF